MKTTTIIAVLLLFLGSPPIMAQNDILDAIMESAAAQENAGNQAQSEADQAAQSEAAAAWHEEWEEMMEENAELLNEFDNKYLRCIAMMEMYVAMYRELVDDLRLGDVVMTECDALGMETLVMAMSTTIMYCPEGFTDSELNDDQRYSIIKEYATLPMVYSSESVYGNNYFYRLHHDVLGKYQDWLRESGYPSDSQGDLDTYYRNFLVYLMEYFRPRYILPRTLEIGRKMEALGCSG